jgi:copper homeostasis protein
MNKKALLEMSVETLDAAIAAVRGGADRIELCENLSVGGVTPSAELMRDARAQIKVPIFVMIRPRGGDFCYSPSEFSEMKSQIASVKSAGMDGVVFGILTKDGHVDVEQNEELALLSKPLPVTFHRAFDELRDLTQGLEDVIASGATRVLTSGGEPTAEEGCREIARLIRQASGRITILPGGGIRPANLSQIARETRASEFHSGLSNLLPYPRHEHLEFEAGVRQLVRLLEEESRNLEPAPSGN